MFHAGNLYLDTEEETIVQSDAGGIVELDECVDHGEPGFVRIQVLCNNQSEVSLVIEGLGETRQLDFKKGISFE